MRHASRALAARGALCGALGGLAAGLLDFVLALPSAAAFLPSGRAALLVFLGALCGAAAAAAGAALGLALAGLAATDLGPLTRRAFGSREADEAPRGARVAAYALAVLLVGGLHGAAVRAIAAAALLQF